MHFTNEFEITSMFSSCVSMFFPLLLSYIYIFFFFERSTTINWHLCFFLVGNWLLFFRLVDMFTVETLFHELRNVNSFLYFPSCSIGLKRAI